MALLLCWGHTFFIALWTWIHLWNAFSSFVELWSQLLVTFYDALKTISVTAQATHAHQSFFNQCSLGIYGLPTEVSGEIVWHQKPQINPQSCDLSFMIMDAVCGRQADLSLLLVPSTVYQMEVSFKQEFHTLLTMWFLSAAASMPITKCSSFLPSLVALSVSHTALF